MEHIVIPKILDHSLHDLSSIPTNNKNKVYKAILYGKHVFIKQVKNYELAKKEYESQSSAYYTLKSQGLNVPQPILYSDSWIISEFIDGISNNAEIPAIHKSIDYLHKLHHVDFRNVDPKGHYFGNTLINRLREEQAFLSQAVTLYPELMINQKEFERILHIALSHAEMDEPVLGHGDFQPKNIIFQNSDLYPVDWLDFGFVLRWYELGNLLLLQDFSTLRYAVKLYLQLGYKLWNPSREKIIKAAISIAGIIRTGSYFRFIVDSNSLPPVIKNNIKLNMAYMKSILN